MAENLGVNGLEIGALPLLPPRTVSDARGNLGAPEPNDNPTDHARPESDQRFSSFLRERIARARVAALQADRFELQRDVSSRARIALQSYQSIQGLREEDALGGLIGVDISV